MPRSAYERSKGVERVTWREFPLGKGIALSILDETTATGRQVNGQTLGVGFVAPPKREVSSSATPEDVTVATDRLRPGGVPPPKWIRDQVLALFGHSGRSQG